MAPVSPIHVQLFPASPPTSDTLEARQRLRQLHSARKLKPATPLVLHLNTKVDIKPMLTPRTKAIRRKGQLFNSPTSSLSSTDSDDFFINTRSGMSPSSSRSSSPDGSLVVKENDAGSRMSVKSHGLKLKKKGPQLLTQPCLLRLRSVPVPPIKSRMPPVQSSKTPSPVSSSFNMETPTSPILPTYPTLTESEKRRKLAKLARTLGENVPPELVFRSPPIQRSSSLSVARPKKLSSSHKPSQSVAVPPTIPETPAPQPRLLRRQRSTLSTSTTAPPSAVADTRGTTSVDRVTITIDPPTDAADAETTKRADLLAFELEWGRRKEREWSGEWNVKDMKHVASALRDLKGR